MRLNLWRLYSDGDTRDEYRPTLSEDEYDCFIEFVELNCVSEYEWPVYIEAYIQMLKDF